MSSGKNKNTRESRPAAPLMCWDIFMDGYSRLQYKANDMQLLNDLARKHNWKQEWDLEEKFLRQGKTILVTDTTQKIVFASYNMILLNGYSPADVTGKKPAIFQGKDTSIVHKSIIRNAISAREPFRVSLLNYKKGGETYLCNIEGFPVFSHQKKLMHFIAFES